MYMVDVLLVNTECYQHKLLFFWCAIASTHCSVLATPETLLFKPTNCSIHSLTLLQVLSLFTVDAML